jgi:glutathionylspermidine synthase
MIRHVISPRNRWQQTVEQLGFGFHTTEVPYWDESVYYTFSMQEVTQIEQATNTLWGMCLEAVQYAIDQKLFEQFHIPERFIPYLVDSWEADEPSIYGRFDLCYKEGQIKLLEFNADTPTSLYEAGIVQWFWLQDIEPAMDQFNSIHEKLIDCWKYLKPHLHPGPLHFSCVKETLEDLTNCAYLRDCAIQAGIDTRQLYIDDIGWDDRRKVFVDLDNTPIQNLFKLYPWEWMIRESFGQKLLEDRNHSKFIEPAWKMMLSNKAILPIIWQLFPDHPLLLPAFFEQGSLTSYARKPIFSREGANIDLVQNNQSLFRTEGEYGEEGFVYQALFELPSFEGNYPVIGSWVIGQESAGIGIRESGALITDNLSRFVPHMIK